jgi:DNA-binding HxlR family transcriptional regulator
VNWQNLMRQLAPLRTRWDQAVPANLADSDAPVRPADLIKAINEQSDDGQISWKVMEDRLRRLEASGYVARCEVLHAPRKTHYWLLPGCCGAAGAVAGVPRTGPVRGCLPRTGPAVACAAATPVVGRSRLESRVVA